MSHGIKFLTVFSLLALGCSKVEFAPDPSHFVTDASSSGLDGSDDFPPTDSDSSSDPKVCDPFGGSSGQVGKGLVGDIFYMPSGRSANSVNEFFTSGIKASAGIVLNQVNVPLRDFTEGFGEGNNYVRNDQGEKLVEYFALRMRSVLKLTSSQAEGYYQFRVKSDDGSVLYRASNGQVLVDNDGTHSLQARCSSQAIYMTSTSGLPIRFDYYQGPRTSIALVLEWRRVGSAQASDCGDSDWQVIPPENFNLPNGTIVNCL